MSTSSQDVSLLVALSSWLETPRGRRVAMSLALVLLGTLLVCTALALGLPTAGGVAVAAA